MAKLKFIIEGNNKSGVAALTGTQAKLKQISTTVKKTSATFAKYGTIATGVATAVLIATTKQSLRQIDALAKQADQIGITTEALATFQHLGELTGVSTEKINSSLERMVKRLGEASTGMGAAKKTLEGMNLSANALIKERPEEAYRKIAASIREMGTQAEKSAAVAAIFGREGLALLNTIEAGDEAFIRAARDAELFGTAISRLDAAKVEEFNDSFTRVQEVVKGMSRRLTVELAPIMQVLSDRFVNAARESEGFSSSIRSGIEKAAKVVGFLGDTVRGLQVAWKIAEVAALGFTSLTITSLDELQKAAAAVASWIPGLDVEPSSAISEWAEVSRGVLDEVNSELDELVSKPMPSRNIEAFFTEVAKQSEITAQKIADMKKVIDPVDGEEITKIDAQTQKIIEAHAKKYETLNNQAELAFETDEERANIELERKLAEIELDKEMLVEKNALNAEQEEMFRQAELDARILHLAKMEGIQSMAESSNQRLWEGGWKGRIQLASDSMNELAKTMGSKSKAIFNINKAFSIAQSSLSLPSSVMQSFEKGGGYPLGLIPAGLMLAKGAVEISKIKKANFSQAHDGLDSNPDTGTFLLKRNEMVLDSGTSKEVREAARNAAGGSGGGITIGEIVINTVKDLREMTATEWDEAVEEGLAPAIRRGVDKLLDFGLQPTEEFA